MSRPDELTVLGALAAHGLSASRHARRTELVCGGGHGRRDAQAVVPEGRGAYGRSGTPPARTSTELRALFSSLRTSPPITTWPAGAPGCDPTTIRSAGSALESRTVAPSFAASARAVSRATSFVGPARGTAIDLIAPSNCVRRPAAAMATATEPPSRRY